MSETIDLERLYHSILGVIDESIQDTYDFDVVLKSAEIVWDGTAVQVKGKDFSMVFDLISYELVDYTGFDSDGGDE